MTMRPSRRSWLWAVAAFLCAGAALHSCSFAADSEPAFAAKLRPLLLAKMKEMSTPGAIVLVDVPGQGNWVEAFGVKDLAANTPTSVENHMRIGSITKTLTGTAILQLVDQGKIGELSG